MGKVLIALAFVAFVFALDFFMDFPGVLYLPGIWDCGGDGFQFCIP